MKIFLISECPSNCVSCKRDNFCEECINDGDFLIQRDARSGRQCEACDSNTTGIANCKECEQCDSDDKSCRSGTAKCEECKSGFSLGRNKKSCIATVVNGNCSQYLESEQKCLKCASGFYKNAADICEECSTSNCDVCKSSSCIKCKAGTVMAETANGIDCVADSANTPCNIANCQNCDKTTFTHKCNQCSDGYNFIKGGEDYLDECFQCQTSFNCKKCIYNQADSCETCQDGFLKVLDTHDRSLTPSSFALGICVQSCPTDAKFPFSDTSIAYYFHNDTKTCIPCPEGWSTCNITNNQFVLNGTCVAGFKEIGNGTTKDCQPCGGKGCSACSQTANSTQCATCDSNHFLNTSLNFSYCQYKWGKSSEVGKYLNLETNTTIDCPQANCRMCKGPNSDDCLKCEANFGVKRLTTTAGTTRTCAACDANCSVCFFDGDGTSKCQSCKAGLCGTFNRNDSLTCSNTCPAGYYGFIDLVHLANPDLASFLGLNETKIEEERHDIFDHPVVRFLSELYKPITPKARVGDYWGETAFYHPNENSESGAPIVYSSLDDTPIKYSNTTNTWQISYNNSVQDISIISVICENNCITCPSNYPKFVHSNGSSECLSKCPSFYVANDTGTEKICVIPDDKLVVQINFNSNAGTNGEVNVQDYLSAINLTASSLNTLQIGSVEWSLVKATNLLNKNISEADLISHIPNGVTLNSTTLSIAPSNFQKFPFTQLVFQAVATQLNGTLTAKASIQIFLDASDLLSKFVISPATGVSADTNFTAEYEIKAAFMNSIGNPEVKPQLMCFPDDDTALETRRRLLQSNNGTNRTNGSNSSSKNKPALEIERPDNFNGSNSSNSTEFIARPKNDPNFNPDFDPDQESKDKEEKKLEDERKKSEKDKKGIRDSFDYENIIVRIGNGSADNITFKAPYSSEDLTYSCFLFLEFGKNSPAPVEEIRDSQTIKVTASTKTISEILQEAKEGSKNGPKTTGDLNEQGNLIASSFQSGKNDSSGSGQGQNITCDKNGVNSVCCPPDNLCSGNGVCTAPDDEEEEGGLVNTTANNSTKKVFNRRYYCKCNEGFAGVKCEANETVYNECTSALETLLEEYEDIDDLDTEEKVIQQLSTLETLAKTCIKSFNGIKGLLKKLCATFKKCQTEDCIDLGIGAIAELSWQTPFLSDQTFVPGAADNGTLSEDQKNVAKGNKRKFISDLDKCFDDLIATAADISFGNSTNNVTTKIIKKGSLASLVGENDSGANATCKNITNSTDDGCFVEIPDDFGGENGTIRYQITPEGRDQYADFEGGSSLVSDPITISISKNGTVLKIANSPNNVCMELKNLNPTVNSSSIVSFSFSF